MHWMRWILILVAMEGFGMNTIETDTLRTSQGPLVLHFIGHGTLMCEWDGMIIHIDPWSKLADYSLLPPGDLVLVTHEHYDHLDEAALEAVLRKEGGILVWTTVCSQKLSRDGIVMKNGEDLVVDGLHLRAVPAYNLKKEYHPRGVGNGYIIDFADLRMYVAGDTEDIPEMKDLEDVDVAFLPMNLPYTMSPAMTAHAARMVNPAILYPYHYGETNPQRLIKLLKKDFQGEIRIRQMP